METKVHTGWISVVASHSNDHQSGVFLTCLIPQKALGSKGDSYFGKGLCGKQADLYQSIFRGEAIPQAQRPKIVVWGMKSSDPDGEEQSEECSAF